MWRKVGNSGDETASVKTRTIDRHVVLLITMIKHRRTSGNFMYHMMLNNAFDAKTNGKQ